MSVEYSAGIAKGYKIPEADVERFPEEIFYDLRDYGFLLCLNTWCDGDYILTWDAHEITDTNDYCTNIAEIQWNETAKEEIINTFKRYFPERANEEPKSLLYYRVY